jgi:DNA-binding transcriptional LysR family regulator
LAEALLRGLEELDRAAGLPVAPQGELRVGAGDALGRRRLPAALARLLERAPGLEVRLREGPGPRLLDALREGEIDLALVVEPPPGTIANGIDIAPCLESEVRLLAPPRHRFAARKRIRLDSLAGERLVALQPGSGFRRHLDSAFDAAGLPFHPAVEVGNLSLVRRFVAAGLGLAPVPAIAFSSAESFPGVHVLQLSGVPRVAYHRALRAGAPQSEPSRLLLHFLEQD